MEPSVKLAHIVFATNSLDEMIAWYLGVFEARIQHRNEQLAFVTYDEEHHRFAFLNLGPEPPAVAAGSPATRVGGHVHHVAFSFPDIVSLCEVYRRLRDRDIRPYFSVRHGPTLSMYYSDPDDNHLEFQVDLLGPDAANAFLQSPAFAANPIGQKFDPDELIGRIDTGETIEDLVLRSDQEPTTITVRV